MQWQVFRLTPQELYEKMWSRPAISLAEEFGISGRGLGKICSRFEIPVPPRGYWANLAARSISKSERRDSTTKFQSTTSRSKFN